MHAQLKLAVLLDGRPQYQLARDLGWSESRLCRVIRGVIDATPADRARIAELLGVPERKLFDREHRSGGPSSPARRGRP